ncbi:MAG: transposase, partial [Thermoguttaceae bacterium]|nr:transposase [Thermoguttaceae bacterium]
MDVAIPRGNVRVDNLTFLNALLYAIENGCKWRALPKEFGKWSTIYKRFRR